MSAPKTYQVDPADPRAPTLEQWERLSPAERQSVMAQLPSEVDLGPPPEGDLHRIPKQRGLEALDAFFRRAGRRVYLSSPAHEVVRPDVVGWRRARLPAPWGMRPLTVAPDWICEILSPSYERRDRVHKADLYARSGVAYYWLVAPVERFVEAFELRNASWLRIGAWQDDEPARIRPFEEIELDLSRSFPPRGR